MSTEGSQVLCRCDCQLEGYQLLECLRSTRVKEVIAQAYLKQGQQDSSSIKYHLMNTINMIYLMLPHVLN